MSRYTLIIKFTSMQNLYAQILNLFSTSDSYKAPSCINIPPVPPTCDINTSLTQPDSPFDSQNAQSHHRRKPGAAARSSTPSSGRDVGERTEVVARAWYQSCCYVVLREPNCNHGPALLRPRDTDLRRVSAHSYFLGSLKATSTFVD
jgi:hypothetical protein